MAVIKTNKFGGRPWRRKATLRNAYICIISGLIAVVWSAQVFRSFVYPFLGATLPRTWPFLDYPMYSEAKFKGSEIKRLALIGRTNNGNKIRLSPEDFGIGYWHFERLIKGIKKEEREIVKDMFDILESRRGYEVVEVRIVNEPLVFVGHGVRRADPNVVKVYSLNGEVGRR